jgi:hypothetical protein
MFTRKPDTNNQLLEETIERVMLDMKDEDPHTEKFALMSTQLTELYKIRNETRSRRVSPDTMAQIIANIFGIGIIVGYEQKHIITSKALGFVRKIF